MTTSKFFAVKAIGETIFFTTKEEAILNAKSALDFQLEPEVYEFLAPLNLNPEELSNYFFNELQPLPVSNSVQIDIS